MRAISTGLLALMLVPISVTMPGAVISMADVVGGSTSSAPAVGAPAAAPVAWGTHADSLRAEALLPAAEVRRPLERFLGQYNSDRVLGRRISRAGARSNSSSAVL